RTIVRRARVVLLAGALAATGACSSLLDVDNPNNVGQDDLQEPGSVSALVNGALAATAEAYTTVTRAHVTITDEYDWSGSWDAAGEMERGALGNTANDFTQEGFNDLAQARWLSDEAYRLTSEFEAAGTLPNPLLLARAALYSGINYLVIADSYEDFAFSDKRESGQPIGPANMHTLYDQAVARFAEAESIAGQAGDQDLRLAAIGLTARAHYAKALWQMLNAGGIPADPLISVAAADAAASQVLQLAPAPDWRFIFTFSSTTTANVAGSWINQRNEMIVSAAYAQADASGKKICSPFNEDCTEDGITYEDPIDAIPDPALKRFVFEFIEGVQFAPQTVIGVREMRLILAESALQQGDTPGFVAQINAVRALEALTPYDPGTHPITTRDMLIHTRLVNLFLQPMRRLGDLYRFDITVPEWLESSEAATQPGTVFPISDQERLANCYFNGSCS
ncbi:MAG: hypothetical protein ACREKM_07465, partial [Longimicrobiales bacterium]